MTGRGPWAYPLNPGDEVQACRPRHRNAEPATVVTASKIMVELRFADGSTTHRYRHEVYRAGTDTTGVPPADTHQETSAMPTTTKTGVCPECRLEVDLTRGVIKNHPAANGTDALCSGSKSKPAARQAAAIPGDGDSDGDGAPTVVEPTLEHHALAANRPEGAWSGATAGSLDPALLDVDPNNPRKDFGNLDELALSLVAQGMLEPVIVTPGPTEGRYTIVAGHRRTAAAIMANLTEIPVLIRVDLTPGSNLSLVAQIVENLHRLELTPLDEARAYDLLRNMGLKQGDIATAVGVNQGQVSKRLALLKLPDAIADKVGADLDVATAVELTRLPAKARDAAVAEMGRGVDADRAVRTARAKSDKETAHQAIIDRLEAAHVALVDFPSSWHWGRDREDRPLATDATGDPQPYAGARTLDIRYVEHSGEPCHGATVSPQDEIVYVCLDPTRHGYDTPEQEEAALDAERVAADEEREALQAATDAALQARRDAARTTALADVKQPYMTDVVASWIVDTLALGEIADGLPAAQVDVVDLLLGWTPDLEATDTELDDGLDRDDDQVTVFAVGKLTDHHGHLRLAYMTVVASIEVLIDLGGWYVRQLAGGPVLRDHYNRLAELADYEPTDAERAWLAEPVPQGPVTIPEGPPYPDGALAWYDPLPEQVVAGDEPRWVLDAGELSAIAAAGHGSRLVLLDQAAVDVVESSPETEVTKADDASPVDEPEVIDIDGSRSADELAADAAARAEADAAHAVDSGDVPTAGERCPASRKPHPDFDGKPLADVACPAGCGLLVSTTASGRVRDHDVPEV